MNILMFVKAYNNEPIFIVPEKIVCIESNKSGTSIQIDGEITFTVKESIEEVVSEVGLALKKNRDERTPI